MLKRTLGISALFLFCAVGWNAGASLSADGLGLALGVIFGMMAGIPAALIAATATKTVRHEHTHRIITEHTHRVVAEQPIAPTVQPTVEIAQSPQRLTVVDERNKLATSISKRLEVHQ